MRFSICIPNYNYEKYLGKTIQSALDQSFSDLEILVADNLSTDDSVAVVHSFDDSRISLTVNNCNIGFARNLDKAASMATGDVMLMLSSDDLMRSSALDVYHHALGSIGDEVSRCVFSSSVDIVDPDDNVIGRIGPDPELWQEQDRANIPGVDGTVYRVDSDELLRRCLATTKNPFNFLSTAYPRGLYQKVEGYGGGRLISPDKWFHWRLLGVARRAYFIDLPLFAYRWHPSNQTEQQRQSGALKHSVDDYANTLEIDGGVLDRLGVSRQDVEQAFVERAIAMHGLATLARRQPARAKRICAFGWAAYPRWMHRNRKVLALRFLLSLGPVGVLVAGWLYRARQAEKSTGTID